MESNIQEIKFYNDEQQIKLGGQLFVPEGTGPFLAVVMIHGSGISNRNNPWYLTLTKYLQKKGVVVLLPDKRGCNQSEGDWRTSSLIDLATDTVSAISYLKEQSIVNISKIGIVGISQGGRIAPVVSNMTSLDFIINIVGATVPLYEQLQFEEKHNLKQLGVLSGIIAYISAFYIRYIKQRQFWKKVGNFDPIPYWKTVNISTLMLYGENDTNTPTTKSVERLMALNKSNICVKIYKHLGHALEDENRIFREDALKDISGFIYQHD